MESQELQRVLEAAVVGSWPALAWPPTGLGGIHIEYELGATGKVTFLRPWSSKRRGFGTSFVLGPSAHLVLETAKFNSKPGTSRKS